MRQLLQVRIESPAFQSGAVLVAELTGRESISRLFELDLRVVTPGEPIDEDALLTSSVTVVFERRAADSGSVLETRRITGIVCELRDRSLTESKHREYALKLVPRAWQATLTSTSDVMMDMSIPDIIQKKLGDGAALEPGKDIELRLKGKYEPREFVVQYKESNLAFACRLAEDLGIAFYFEEAPDGREVMVFSDDNAAMKPSAPETSPFTSGGAKADIYELETHRQLVPKAFVARDYNYRNPAMDLLGEAQAPALGTGKIDEYGPHAKTPEEASFYATIRAQEALAKSMVFEGKSDLPGLRAGSSLKVEGHPRGDLEMVVTEVVHHVAQNVAGFGEAADQAYANSFKAIPKKHVFRPARLTPKPLVHGVVTGLVEAGSATELGAIDEQGRYRVAFMYDSVQGRGDGKASRPLRMAQPSAGDSRGFHLPLKPGTEVLVTCLNGDPDRPIIAGAVNNPRTPSPVTSANAEKSMWTTNKASIAIDDAEPRCKISVNGDNHVFQIGEPNGPELGFFTGTASNVASMADGGAAVVSNSIGAYHDYKTAVAAQDIVNMAGIPHPWGLWKKLDAVVTAVPAFLKAASKTAGVPQQIAIGHAEMEKAAKDAAYAKAKKDAVANAALVVITKQKDNDDGTKRMETEAEALDRTLSENLKGPAHEAAATALQKAATEAQDAAAELAAYKKWWEETWLNVETGKTAEYIKAVEGVQGAIKAAGKLVSTVSKVFEKATHEALHVGFRMVAVSAAKDSMTSGQRKKTKVGTFMKSFNIQAATDSAGLSGGKCAIVYGGNFATVYSTGTAQILGNQSAHLKSPGFVEMAANDCYVTGKKTVDIKSSDLINVNADQTMSLCSVKQNIGMKAKTKMMVEVEDHDFTLKAKENVSLKAETQNLVLEADKGPVFLTAKDNDALIVAKKRMVLRSQEATAELMADGGDALIHAKAKVEIKCKKGVWEATDLDLKAKHVVIFGSKVELG